MSQMDFRIKMTSTIIEKRIRHYRKLLPANTYLIELDSGYKKLSNEEILSENNIPFDNIIYCNEKSEQSNSHVDKSTSVAGSTIYFKKDDKYFSVVMINLSYINTLKHSHELIGNIIHLITVIHEFKHAEDAMNGKNINLSKNNCDLINFEIEAEIKTVETFKKDKTRCKFALQYLAIRLIKMSQHKDEYSKKIGEGVIAKYSIETFNYWSKLDLEFYNIYKDSI
jgi:hypothetical protein